MNRDSIDPQKAKGASNSMRKNVSLSLVRQIAGVAMQLCSIIIIAKTLGPEGTGQFAIAVIAPNLLSKALGLGIGPSNVYYIGQGAISAVNALRRSFVLIAIASFIGLGFGLPTLLYFSDTIFPNVSSAILTLGFLSFPLILLNEAMASILQGKEDFKGYNISLILQPAGTLTTLSLLLLVFNGSIPDTIYALLFGQSIAALTLYFSIRKLPKEPEESNAICPSARTMIKYGCKAQLANILAIINKRSDLYILNLLISPTVAGVYSIAAQICERLKIIPGSISAVIFPRLSSNQSNVRQRTELIETAFRVSIFLTTIACVTIALISAPLLNYAFGPDFLDARSVLLIILLGVIASSGSSVLANAIAAKGRPELNTLTSAIVLFFNVLGNILLIPRYGMNGAAATTSLSFALNFVFKIFLTKRLEPDLALYKFAPTIKDLRLLLKRTERKRNNPQQSKVT